MTPRLVIPGIDNPPTFQSGKFHHGYQFLVRVCEVNGNWFAVMHNWDGLGWEMESRAENCGGNGRERAEKAVTEMLRSLGRKWVEDLRVEPVSLTLDGVVFSVSAAENGGALLAPEGTQL